jgi:hypothetical protein
MSLSIGAACAIAFIVAAVRGGDATSSETTAAPVAGSGFATGLLLGVGVGIVIGFFVGRRAQAPDHSSRNRP